MPTVSDATRAARPWRAALAAVTLSVLLGGCTTAKWERVLEVVLKPDDAPGTPPAPPQDREPAAKPPSPAPQVSAPSPAPQSPAPPPAEVVPPPSMPSGEQPRTAHPAVPPEAGCGARLDSFNRDYDSFVRGGVSATDAPIDLLRAAEDLWMRCADTERQKTRHSIRRAFILFFSGEYQAAGAAFTTVLGAMPRPRHDDDVARMVYRLLENMQTILTQCTEERDALKRLRMALAHYQGEDYEIAKILFQQIKATFGKRCHALRNFAQDQLDKIEDRL